MTDSAPPSASSSTPYDHLVVAEAGPFRIRAKHRDDLADDFAWRRDPETARFDGALPLKLTFDPYFWR